MGNKYVLLKTSASVMRGLFGTEPLLWFTFGTKNLSNKQPASLRWDGAPLERNESVVFMWESTDGGLTVPMEITGSQGMDHIDFPAAQMAKIPSYDKMMNPVVQVEQFHVDPDWFFTI